VKYEFVSRRAYDGAVGVNVLDPKATAAVVMSLPCLLRQSLLNRPGESGDSVV